MGQGMRDPTRPAGRLHPHSAWMRHLYSYILSEKQLHEVGQCAKRAPCFDLRGVCAQCLCPDYSPLRCTWQRLIFVRDYDHLFVYLTEGRSALICFINDRPSGARRDRQ